MPLVKAIFWIAGIYGVLLVAPMYLMEDRIGRDDPPPINHAEYFYGFVAVCLISQLLYLLIATDPVRYRPAMLLGAAGKTSFFLSTAILFFQGRVAGTVVALATIDLLLAVLFVIAWKITPKAWFPREL